MFLNFPDKIFSVVLIFCLAGSSYFFTGCTVVRKYQKNVPIVYKNNINLKIDNVTSDEKVLIRSRLNSQLDDSSKIKIKDVVFFLHYIDRPPAFDTISARQSADNMQTSMANIGFYNSKVDFHYTIDTLESKHQLRVNTTYEVEAGKRTLIDTFAYQINKEELQRLALETKDKSPLQKNLPVTKAGVQDEESRLVDVYRNNGYYKFTTDELRVSGDTTIAALTTVSEDAFEALRLLAEANEKRNKPTIKLAIHLNPVSDTNRFKKYQIRNVYILPDYSPGDNYTDTGYTENIRQGTIIRFHKKLFLNNVLTRNIYLKSGDVYNQDNYYKTLNSFYKLGVWESPAVDITEAKDSNYLDVIFKLIPVKKYGFEGGIEVSYSANSNSSNLISATNSGNLLGLSGNVSLLNRNVQKKAVRITHSIRAGVEFNTSRNNNSGSFINSNELGYSNNILIPKLIFPLAGSNKKFDVIHQTFLSTNVSQINRLDFFNQQIFNFSLGYNFSKKTTHSWTWIPFNFDYRRLYNRSDRFDSTLKANPFLKYSFNTALVIGQSLSYTSNFVSKKNPKNINAFKFNIEESGLIFGRLKDILTRAGHRNFLTNYLKQFIKTNVEYSYTITHPKSALVFRTFGGVGIPFSKNDTTLPFFKQYFGGGPNSMRGWPVRGIGIGGQPLAPYSNGLFNDRTGDIQVEGNVEYRYNISQLFSNAVLLKGAFFIDAGNIWNLKNTKADGSLDSTQFKFKNFYKQLGVDAGLGFRFDFSYFLIRFDMGFRFKRPDITANDGWQFPSINLQNIFGNTDANRRWRYENYNFTIGIDYPF